MNKGYLWLLLTALLWSLAGIVIRSSEASGLIVCCFSSLVAIPVTLLLRRKKVCFNKTILLVAVAHFIMSLTFIYANTLTTVANALFLQYTSTIFVLVYQSLDEKRWPSRWQCLIILWVMIGMGLFLADGFKGGHLIGNILALVSGGAFGIEFYVNTKKEADAYSSSIIAYGLAAVLCFAILHQIPHLSVHSWASMMIYGVLVIGFAGVCFSLGIKRVPALTANLICMLEILMSPLWAYFLFKETITPLSMIGALMIVSAVIVVMVMDTKTSSIDCT